MTKRVLLTGLWFTAAWYLGAEIAYMLGFSPSVGPMIGVVTAILVQIDPGRVVGRTRLDGRASTKVHAPTH